MVTSSNTVDCLLGSQYNGIPQRNPEQQLGKEAVQFHFTFSRFLCFPYSFSSFAIMFLELCSADKSSIFFLFVCCQKQSQRNLTSSSSLISSVDKIRNKTNKQRKKTTTKQTFKRCLLQTFLVGHVWGLRNFVEKWLSLTIDQWLLQARQLSFPSRHINNQKKLPSVKHSSVEIFFTSGIGKSENYLSVFLEQKQYDDATALTPRVAIYRDQYCLLFEKWFHFQASSIGCQT